MIFGGNTGKERWIVLHAHETRKPLLALPETVCIGEGRWDESFIAGRAERVEMQDAARPLARPGILHRKQEPARWSCRVRSSRGAECL